ncbi:MAG: acetyltransferase [Bacteroidota bacterium]
MATDPLVLVGGGGHCLSCIDVIDSTMRFEILGILDLPEKQKIRVLKYEIIGTDDDIERYLQSCRNFFVTIGHIKNPRPRISTFQLLKKIGVTIPSIISPRAYVSSYAEIGEGTIVMHGAIVNANARIGANTIINTGAIIEHNAKIGDHTHISTQAVVNGDCTIGDRVFVGSNAVFANGVSIADDIIVGAGAVVVRSFIQPGTYVGNAARKIR